MNGAQPAVTDTTFADLLADDEEYVAGTYVIDGYYFVEVPAASADHKLTAGSKTLYLKWVTNPAVLKFEDEVKAVAVVDEDDATCGDFYVADLDEDDVYYVAYDKDGVPTVYVADETVATNVLVDGKLVAAKVATAVEFQGHDYKGYEVVNYEYVSVKCAVCDKVATLYANATAAGKKAQPVAGGWVTFADMFTYGVVADAPAADEKVESAETFDAGIAMYVGMSVMAAAGSAVVLKKKD